MDTDMVFMWKKAKVCKQCAILTVADVRRS